jgi:hypothetical protein
MAFKRQNSGVLLAVLSILVVGEYARAAGHLSPAMPYSLGAEEVTAALATRGISMQTDQVEFLAPVKSRRPEPALEVERLQAANRASLLARIRCREAGECLPFYVVLHLSDKQQSQALLERLPATASPVQAARTPTPRPNWVVRAGQRATFVLEREDVRASAPVICLQNGQQGESIRVSSLDHKRIMVGEIVAPGLLHGAL